MSPEALFFLGVLIAAVIGVYLWLWSLLREDDEPGISQADRDQVERERQEFDRRRAEADVAARMSRVKGKS